MLHTRERIERYIERERRAASLRGASCWPASLQGGATALLWGCAMLSQLGGIIALSGYLPLRGDCVLIWTAQPLHADPHVPWPRGCRGAAGFGEAIT